MDTARGSRIKVRVDLKDEQNKKRHENVNIVEITQMASCRVRDHLIRRNVSSRRINSKIAIVREQSLFLSSPLSLSSPPSLPLRNCLVLFATIQLLRIYRRHKLHAPFIWPSTADKSDLSRALYAFPADRAGCTFEMIHCAA